MKKILVTEDSIGWQRFHVDMLHQIYGDDVQVDVASCAREGYDVAYNNLSKPYDLIITDLQMESDFEPQYAGEWFIEQIQLLNQYSRTPIIIMSACYNIRTIADVMGVHALPKAQAARDLNAYKLALLELLPI